MKNVFIFSLQSQNNASDYLFDFQRWQNFTEERQDTWDEIVVRKLFYFSNADNYDSMISVCSFQHNYVTWTTFDI
jgi:hypothetical protein